MENKNMEKPIVNDKQEAGKGKTAMPMRTYLVMILAGGYVAYLGVSLCKNVINGAEGSSTGFMVAGVIFIVLGVVFVINGIRGSIKASKAQKEQDVESEAQVYEKEAPGTVESKMESTSFQDKKMSIADRANLVSQLGDRTEDEE